MFDFPGFDPKTLSDDELSTKLTDLQAKSAYASRFSSPGLMESLQRIVTALQLEQHERAMRRAYEVYDKMTPDVIETDPGLADKPASPEKGPGKIAPQTRPRMSISRTSKPTDTSTT